MNHLYKRAIYWFVSVSVTFSTLAISLGAGEVRIQLAGVSPVSRRVMYYECDATGSKLGLPKGSFPVEYINGGGNSLAIITVSGKTLIFVSAASGSGARYVSQQYIWWEARGRRILFRQTDLKQSTESECKEFDPPGGKQL